MENWKDVVGLEDYFRVSDSGKVFSKRTNKILKQGKSKTGYFVISTRIGGRSGKPLCLKVHRMVAEAFISNLENEPIVNHIDGNKLNNQVNNLEWCDHSHNVKHSYDTGLRQPTKDFKCLELNDEQRNFIVKNYTPNCRRFGARALGRMFGCNKNSIINYYNHVKTQS